MTIGIRLSVSAIAMLLTASVGQAASWYVAPGGTGSGTSPGSPLGSINSAFQLSNQGDIIELAPGNYSGSGNTINDKAATGGWTQNVIIRSTVPLAANFTSNLQVNAARVTLSGLTSSSPIFLENRTVGHATVENSKFSSTLYVRTNNVQVLNNEFANGIGADAIQVAAYNPAGSSGSASFAGRIQSDNILIEGNYIHDYINLINDPIDVHEDGIQLFDTKNVTIRGNTITNVADSSIITSNGRGIGVHNVLIENNFLRTTNNPGPHGDTNVFDGYGVFNLLEAPQYFQNIQIINNTILAEVHIANSDQILLRNNIINRIQAMGFLAKHDHNLIGSIRSGQGITPDATDVVGTLPTFVDYSTADLHIAPGNTIDLAFANSIGAPNYDFDGELRSVPRWVGADQFTTPIPEPSASLLSMLAIAGALFGRGRRNSY